MYGAFPGESYKYPSAYTLAMPHLKKCNADGIDIFYSHGIKKECRLKPGRRINDHVETIISEILEANPKYDMLANLFAQKKGMDGIAILSAHGEDAKGTWCYENGGELIPVQNWIDRNDGKYAFLVLNCCNPGSREISSRRSAVLAPNFVWGPLLSQNSVGQIELYLPGAGYVDSYLIDYVIKQMKKTAN